MKNRTTKINQVLEHLKKYGSIGPWSAIQNYGVTRLSAIIFNLKKRGYDISSVTEKRRDRNGNVCQFSRYFLNEDGVEGLKK